MSDEQPSLDLESKNLPEILPILPLFDTVLFPKMVLPLVVMQTESVQLIDEAMSKDRIIGLLVSKETSSEKTSSKDHLHVIGTSALILKMAKTEDDKAQILVQGLGRFVITQFIEEKPYLMGQVTHLADKEKKDTETEALMSNIIHLFSKVVDLSPVLPQEISTMAKSIQEPGTLANMIASSINATPEEKQAVLEIDDTKNRLKEVTRLVNHQLEILELGNKIQSQVKGDMDKSQREYYLRQQLKAIKEELGEQDEAKIEIEEYRTKIQEKNLPEEAVKEAERELNRLAKMHPSSAE